MLRLLLALALIVAAGPAFAHNGTDVAGGFASGFLHPLTGPDHIAAMVAVGLWGTFLGRPAIWVLPIVFPLVMAVGGVLGVLGVPLPGVETGIALSAIVLGAFVLFAGKPSLWIAGIVVGAFAIFHGHAHGTELPDAADPVAFAAGFVMATGLLHMGGIAFGALTRFGELGRVAVQACGGIILMAGLAFLHGFA